MKHLQLISLMACAAFLAGCESTETASDTNRSAKYKAKRAAQEEQQQQQGQQDESTQNLWQAQRDINNRDGNSARGRY